jgi:hypothetical protein
MPRPEFAGRDVVRRRALWWQADAPGGLWQVDADRDVREHADRAPVQEPAAAGLSGVDSLAASIASGALVTVHSVTAFVSGTGVLGRGFRNRHQSVRTKSSRAALTTAGRSC